jgi:hypothetical protein
MRAEDARKSAADIVDAGAGLIKAEFERGKRRSMSNLAGDRLIDGSPAGVEIAACAALIPYSIKLGKGESSGKIDSPKHNGTNGARIPAFYL